MIVPEPFPVAVTRPVLETVTTCSFDELHPRSVRYAEVYVTPNASFSDLAGQRIGFPRATRVKTIRVTLKRKRGRVSPPPLVRHATATSATLYAFGGDDGRGGSTGRLRMTRHLRSW